MDYFHIGHKSSLASEGVSHVMTFDLDLYLQGHSSLLWLGIQHDSIVWVIMRRQGVSSESRCSSCSSFLGFLAATKQLNEWYFLSVCPSVTPFLPAASFGLQVLSLPASVCLCVCLSVCVSVNPELVRTINHHVFKLEPPNLDKRCKTIWLRSLLFWGAIDLAHQGQI